jgi:hypothetical protein
MLHLYYNLGLHSLNPALDLGKTFQQIRPCTKSQMEFYVQLTIKCTLLGGIFCDLSKASDCVNNDAFLSKLNFYGLQGTVEQWFKSYLNDRKQKQNPK